MPLKEPKGASKYTLGLPSFRGKPFFRCLLRIPLFLNLFPSEGSFLHTLVNKILSPYFSRLSYPFSHGKSCSRVKFQICESLQDVLLVSMKWIRCTPLVIVQPTFRFYDPKFIHNLFLQWPWKVYRIIYVIS